MLLQFSLRVWSWMSYTRWDMGLAGSRSSALVGAVTRLTQLMIEFGVGVSHRTIRVATLDSDYFE